MASRINDAARLRALALTGLLDTPPEDSFDRLSRLASKLTQAPLAFLSLVDADRDFYKSCVGFDDGFMAVRQIEGPTFCHHALISEGPLVIDDALQHPEFRDLPTVKSIGVRAYCGIPLVTEDGFVIGSFCAVDLKPRVWSELDIEVLTELAKSALREIDLRKRAREAEELIMENERLLANIAHDLRSPLSAIVLSFEMIVRPDAPPERKERAATAHRSACSSMVAMLQNLLQIPTNTGSKMLSPAGIVADAVQMMAPLAQQKGIVLLPRYGAGLLPVEVDYQRLLRVFSNLIGNAIKFSPPDTAIHVEAAQTGSFARFSVKDSGCGISEAHQARVFDRHWQQDKADIRGAGLGLSIAREIVEGFGGSIGVNSVLNEGSEFYFSLPSAADGGLPERKNS